MHIDRRKLLIGIAAAMGGALSAGAAKALDAALDYTSSSEFRALTTDQVALLRAVMDTIIPATETASASGAGVDFYIDHMMANVLSNSKRKAIIEFLTAFGLCYPDFLTQDATTQYRVLSGVDENVHAEDTPFPAYRGLKELILIGYYTSEIGAAVELAYDPIPGPFQNGPITEYDRTWST